MIVTSIARIEETDTRYIVIALAVIAILWIVFKVIGKKKGDDKHSW